MSRIFRTLIVAVALCGLICSCGKESGTSMTIDVSNPQSAYLDDVSDVQKVIPIQEDSTFDVGNVFCSKSYGGMIFLYNDALRQINCVDEEGKPVFSLNALGRGEGEYIDIGTFTYNDEAKTLDIFERDTRTIKSYSVPSMELAGTRQMEYYPSAMEWIRGNCYLFIREWDMEDATPALILYDTETRQDIDSLLLREDQPDMIEDISITRANASDDVLVAVPGLMNIVYSVSGRGISPVLGFKMTPDSVGEKYWSSDYSYEKYMDFISATGGELEVKGSIAENPYFFVDSKDQRSFYYLTGAEWPSHGLPMLNLCLLHGTEAEVYDTLRIKGIDNPISPIGVHNGKYVALLETENLEYSGELGEIAKEIQQAQENGAEHVIVLYSFK